MKKAQDLMKEITQLTFTIEQNYPGLYQHLDENPMTLQGNGKVDVEVLEEYRNGLQKQLEDYKRLH